jgi:hypothetical protein
VGRDREGAYARLHDNVGARGLLIERIPYSRPDVREPVKVEVETKLRSTEGDLFQASWQEFRAAVILPPLIRDLNMLRLANVKPWITGGARSRPTILNWVELGTLWASAQLPGDAFARFARDNVLRAYATSICGLIGGARWTAAERRFANGSPGTLPELAKALGDNAYQTVIANDVKRNASGLAALSLDDRVHECARSCHRIAPKMRAGFTPEWHAEFMLRLASSPSQASSWAGPLVRIGIDMALENPMMLRVARYMVLAVHLSSDRSGGSALYEGWTWD